MKQNYAAAFLLLALATNPVFAADEGDQPPVALVPGTTLTEIRPEKIAVVEKMVELPGIVSNGNKLRGSIGIETLAGIITPLIVSGQNVPVSVSIKLGISSNCDCAKLKLFRVFEEPSRKPEEISYDAIRGFSADNKTVEVELEVTPDSRLHQKVAAPKNSEPGKLLEWMPAKDIKPSVKAPEKVKTESAELPKIAQKDSDPRSTQATAEAYVDNTPHKEAKSATQEMDSFEQSSSKKLPNAK